MSPMPKTDSSWSSRSTPCSQASTEASSGRHSSRMSPHALYSSLYKSVIVVVVVGVTVSTLVVVNDNFLNTFNVLGVSETCEDLVVT